ncbi:acyl-CoA dehydrogenase [Phenylobacterium sp.]|jgi:alkylation response protein AidB-like acyl-CoA dehydrogenase|uniref:acyl-CoA dehydrogenase n=1 Tax=Phenylobacterium sp. TaxID=1871053 RepID=UPI002EDBAF8C
MDLTLGEDEAQIVAMAADVMANEAPLDRWFAAGADAAADEERLRRLAADLGWIGFGAPEGVGGSGVSPVEEILLFREIGRAVGPVSLSAGAAAARIAAADTPGVAGRIVAGEAAVGLIVEAGGGRAWRLGAGGGTLGLVFEDDKLSVVEVGKAEACPSLDPTVAAQAGSRAGMVVLAESQAPDEAHRFVLLVAAQQLGMAEAALGASVAYAKLREQFGRPIGAFQAVRHRCVDMAVRCEKARAQLFFAAVALRDGAADRGFQALAAARACEDAAGRNARDNIFLHGATGVTAENAAHLFLKRSLVWRQVVRPQIVLEAIANGAGPAG